MRRLAWACGLAVMAAGCGDGSRSPQFAAPVEANNGTATTPNVSIAAAKPEASDPAAERVVDEMLLKHTQSEPRRIEQLRTYSCARKGVLMTAAGPRDCEMRVRGVWPDRHRADWTLDTPDGRKTEVFALRGGAGWHAIFARPEGAQPEQVDPGKQAEVNADLWAEWVTVLVPLTDPARRVGPAPSEFTGTNAARVWVADRPPVVVAADPASGLLAKLQYQVRSSGRLITRTLTFGDHKPVGGVLLPHRIEFAEGPLPGAIYKSIEYELPRQIDPTLFEKP